MKLPHLTSPIAGVLLVMMFVMSACVTINIYFPAAAAEKAAEKIVEDVLGPQGERSPEPTPPPKGEKEGRVPLFLPLAATVLDLFVPAAHAATPDFDVDTPKIRQLQASMKKRNSSLSAYYASGAAGFGNNGLVAVRNAGAVGLKERTRFNKLIEAENKDRNALYREIAKANGHPEWEPEVRSVFARKWAEKAGKGWWIQDASGAWNKK